MWFQVLAAAVWTPRGVQFYTWRISDISQLFMQSDFILGWAGNTERLGWLHVHCVLFDTYGNPWIVTTGGDR